jgi:hypothetical protein
LLREPREALGVAALILFQLTWGTKGEILDCSAARQKLNFAS